jgi:FkbM family methyltransferase
MGSFHNGLEDTVLELCKEIKNGFFIDIGAHDGITGNNTEFLEKLGWFGICFEPHPELFLKLEKNRNCEKYNYAIWDKEDKVNFLSIDGQVDMLSGIVESYDHRHINRIQRELSSYGGKSQYLLVDSKKFSSVVSEKKIDFMSLDTEGSELQILKSIDFNDYDIRVICVENNYNDDELNNFLISKKYTLHKTFGVDQIYLKN